jgi:hypothetical protein
MRVEINYGILEDLMLGKWSVRTCLGVVFFGLSTLAFLAGCGGGGGGSSTTTTTPPSISVSVSPSSISLNGGGTQAFTATVANDSANAGVTWSIGSGVGTLSNSTTTGVTYTAPAKVSSSSTVTLTATSKTDTTISGTATITLSPPPTITSVAVSCTPTSVQTGQTSKCTATVTGTGNYSSAVTWSAGEVQGGNSTVGTITTAGLYTAPSTMPSTNPVTIMATSTEDTSQSSSTTLTIVGTLESATQSLTAANGGTITLPSGSSVTIPAGAFASNTNVTLSLMTGLSKQPPSGFIVGVGDALVLSTSTPPINTTAGNIQFVINSGANTTGLQGSEGLADLIDSTGDNFFGVAGSFNSSTNLSTVTIPAARMTGTTSVIVSMSNLPPPYTSQSDAAKGTNSDLQLFDMPDAYSVTTGGKTWNPTSGTWGDFSAGTCPTPPARTLVLVHGMGSSVEEAFGPNNVSVNGTSDYCVNQIVKAAGTDAAGNALYGQVAGFDYNWTTDIASGSGAAFANFLNTLAANCPNNPIDIEAHSEGGPVAAEGIMQASTKAQGLITNFVGLGNPWLGTPAASATLLTAGFIPYTTLLMNPYLVAAGTAAADYAPIIQGMTISQVLSAPFMPELQPDSSLLTGITAGSSTQKSLGACAPNLKMTLACGTNPDILGVGTRVANAFSTLYGGPNDGIIPISSCQAMGAKGNQFAGLKDDPNLLGPYDLSHTQLECTPQVIQDVGEAVNPVSDQLMASPNPVAFPAQTQGYSGPVPTESLAIKSTAGVLAWNATVSSGASWLSISADTGTTPSTVTVSATVGTAGTYSGTISITSADASNSLSIPVTMTVNPETFDLLVQESITGTGSGTITPDPVGTSCGSGCYSYASGTDVIIDEQAGSGSTFVGWSGACSGTGACAVIMNSSQSVTATFNTSTSGNTPEAGNYSGSCTVATSSFTCCANGDCITEPGISVPPESFNATMASGTSLSGFTSELCSDWNSAASAAGCTNESCSIPTSTSNSVSFNLSCAVPEVAGCTPASFTVSCNLSLQE